MIRSFAMAREYIEIDSSVMELGLKFLADNQASNGSFPEVSQATRRTKCGLRVSVRAVTAKRSHSIALL